MPISRKMTVTVTGKDDDDNVNISVSFDPPIGDEEITGGFATVATKAA